MEAGFPDVSDKKVKKRYLEHRITKTMLQLSFIVEFQLDGGRFR